MEFDNTIPIYIQLVEKIKIQIISGKIKPGDKLPSVRDLALEFKVNPNTVQKALAELESKKLIYTERTNGKFVTDNQNLIEQFRNEYASILVNKFLTNMENIGYNKEEIIKCLGGKEWNY